MRKEKMTTITSAPSVQIVVGEVIVLHGTPSRVLCIISDTSFTVRPLRWPEKMWWRIALLNTRLKQTVMNGLAAVEGLWVEE